MDEQTRENFIKAGKITAQVREYGSSLITKGSSLVEVTKKIEEKIEELGGKPAFPPQISCDHIAAHYCPEEDDSTIFESQLACMDVGVHVNGAVGDTAYTVDLSGENKELVMAARKALEEALKVVGVGTTLGEIGRTIQEVITSYGFSPVRNLSGHGIDVYDIHTKPTIPNFDTGDKTPLKEGQVIAIEPFASAGAGVVQDSGTPTVFMLLNKKPVRNMITRQILKEIETYEGLPFAKRWLTEKFGVKANYALRELTQLKIVEQFPPLADAQKGLVAQAEHTVLIEEKPIILTK